MPNLSVRTAVVRGTPLEVANVAARVTVDYLAFVPAGVTWPEDHLRRCVEQLRSDLSVGMAGGSCSGSPAGALDLFVPLGGAVIRHSAFHAIEGFDPAFEVLADLDFGWRLWLRGYRVRSTGDRPPGVEAAPRPGGDLQEATQALLARVLDDTSLEGDLWTSAPGVVALPLRRRPPTRDPALSDEGRRRAAPPGARRRRVVGEAGARGRAGRGVPGSLGGPGPGGDPAAHRGRDPGHAGAADGGPRDQGAPDRPAARPPSRCRAGHHGAM